MDGSIPDAPFFLFPGASSTCHPVNFLRMVSFQFAG